MIRVLIIALMGLPGVWCYAQDTLALGLKKFNEADYYSASLLLQQYAQHHSDSTTIATLAESYFNIQLYDKSALLYENLLLSYPNHVPYLTKLGISSYENSAFKTAAQVWQKTCNMAPNDINNWTYLALSGLKIQDDELAQKALTKVIELNPMDTNAWRTRAYIRLRNKWYKPALQDIDSALKLTQFNAELVNQRALALLGLKQYKEAEKMYEKLLKTDERNYHYWFGIGNVYHAQKNFLKAVDAYSVSTSINPLFELGYFRVGIAALELNDYLTACEAFSKARQLGYTEALTYEQKYCGTR